MANIAAITGHRPERINSFQYVDAQLEYAFRDYRADVVIQGMAPGADLTAAKIAYREKIPFVSVRPWAGHRDSIDEQWRRHWDSAWKYARHNVTIVDQERFPGNSCYQRRNEYMVDNADFLIAVWDGKKKGGTWNTIKYAQSVDMSIWQIDPVKLEVAWLL